MKTKGPPLVKILGTQLVPKPLEIRSVDVLWLWLNFVPGHADVCDVVRALRLFFPTSYRHNRHYKKFSLSFEGLRPGHRGQGGKPWCTRISRAFLILKTQRSWHTQSEAAKPGRSCAGIRTGPRSWMHWTHIYRPFRLSTSREFPSQRLRLRLHATK